MSSYLADPDDKLDYAIDFTGFLDQGETIVTFTVTPDDPALTVSQVSEAAGVVTYWAAGGTDGSTVKVVCHIVTSTGREKDVADRFYIRSV